MRTAPRLLLLVPTATYRAGAFVRAAQRLDIDITLASEEPSSLNEFHPRDLIALDFHDPAAAAKSMRAFAELHPIRAVIGVDDQVTMAAAAIGEALALPHNPPDAAYATLNKHAMRKRLSAAGVPVPEFECIATDEDPTVAALGRAYPSVLKPLMMSASRGVIRVDDADDFARAFRKIADVINAPDAPHDTDARGHILVERYVPGWEVAVEGIVSNGRIHLVAIFDKPDPLEGPYFPETIYVTPSRLSGQVQRHIRALAQEAVTAMGIRHGPVHAELRGSDGGLFFLEIASRSIGGYCSKVLRFEGGLSLEDVIIRQALKPDWVVPPRESRAAGVMMLQAPVAGRFVEAAGLEEARAVDGVEEIILSAHSGQELTPLPEGFLYLGFIFARADRVEDVETSLRSAFAKLSLVVDPPPTRGGVNGR